MDNDVFFFPCRRVTDGDLLHEAHGIRQGDLMSPSLFIIVLEILSRRLEEEVKLGRLELYKVGVGGGESLGLCRQHHHVVRPKA